MNEEEKYTNYNQWGINKSTYDILFSDKEGIRDIDSKERLRVYILYIIETYTKFREKSIFTSLLKIYFGAKTKFDFSKIVWNEKNREYEFEYDGEKYTFDKISNSINNKEARKKLESEKRCRECHINTMMVLGVKDWKVLTGYININGGRYLHSVIETNDGRILDLTRNLDMTKEEYAKLTEFNIIESIGSDELLQIWIKLYDLHCGSKITSVFGPEILKDTERNPNIFVEDEGLRNWVLEIRRQSEQQNGERE